MAIDGRRFNVVVLGSGFAGSLMAMVCRRLGKSVLLVEKGQHPRFAIGESTTPLTNLFLEEIGKEYSLNFLHGLATWGRWQARFPELSCGLKRGFTFCHHREFQPFRREKDRSTELLVAASPSDEVADTHWFREDFDAFLMKQAVRMGVDYVDSCQLISMDESRSGLELGLQRQGHPSRVEAEFVVDASGPRGALSNLLAIGERPIPEMPPTRALYGHFSHVDRFQDVGGFSDEVGLPYPVDDAAIHHVFDRGWFWVLRFNNGRTSAGVVARSDWEVEWGASPKPTDWKRVVSRFPSVQTMFESAGELGDLCAIERLPFLAKTLCSDRWALLPSAASSIDPLFSSGFPLTLLGIMRLGKIIGESWGRECWNERLKAYARSTVDEVERVGRLVGLAYKVMPLPRVFNSVTQLYFAAVSYEESMRRLGRISGPGSFLLGGHASFRERIDTCISRVEALNCGMAKRAEGEAECRELIRRCVEPFDVIGISRVNSANWYPVDLTALFDSAEKLESSREAIRDMLLRSGVGEAELPANGV